MPRTELTQILLFGLITFCSKRLEKELGEALGQKEAKRLPRILIIEDSALIAALLEELVLECGCDVVGLASNIESARLAIAKRDYDAVLLDICLHEGKSFDIADVLLERSVPFAFVTACHEILEPRHRRVPVIPKPFSTTLLMNTVKVLVQLVDEPQQCRLRA